MKGDFMLILNLQLFGGRGAKGSAGGGGGNAEGAGGGKFAPGQNGYMAKSVDGKDIIEKEPLYNPTDGKSSFAMENIVSKQGYDGYPTVMSSKDFNAYLKNNPGAIEMYRGFYAPDSATVKAYNDSLLKGNFYVQNSGGSVYGSGMYAARVYNNKIGPDKELMRSSGITKGNAKTIAENTARGYDGSKVQRMALSPNAKVIDYGDLKNAMVEHNRNAYNSNGKRVRTKYSDEGVFAAAKGYDAIIVTRGGSNYTVILNRTKLVIDNGYKKYDRYK